ncbi:MAG: endonuclease/exonuclease/phosphatase family protein [Paracoccaceae bacterium]
MLRDILSGNDSRVNASIAAIAEINPDILLLTRFDYDLGNNALKAFSDGLMAAGAEYPHLFALAPNSGVQTGLDLNNDGRTGSEKDAHGYGKFAGHGGMALLSKFPIDHDAVQNFSTFPRGDLPGTLLGRDPETDPGQKSQYRLSSVAHWDVPIMLPNGTVLRILAYHATTPVFDGPDDENGRRNYDENMFWLQYLRGNITYEPPTENFVILGNANLDPNDGEGRKAAIRSLLASHLVQDPKPSSPIGEVLAHTQGGANIGQFGNPALDTADWRDDGGPGNLRVDYVLPSGELKILDAGIQWPAPDGVTDKLGQQGSSLSWHGLVWVDVGW